MTDNIFQFQGYQVDSTTRRVTDPGGELLDLRPREFDTLLVLLRSAGSVVGKEQLIAAVWPDTVVEENNLNQAISRLRQAFRDDRKNPGFIATITGRGYQFVSPVEVLSAVEPESPTPPLDTTAREKNQFLGRAVAATLTVVVFALLWFALASFDNADPPVQLDNAVLVSTNPSSNTSPTLSPDGTLLAFVSDRSGQEQIWIKGTATGAPVQLTHGEQAASFPSWAPSSNRILFQSAASDGVQSVWMVDALGSEPPRLITRDARTPEFGADGRSFVFVRGQNEIFIGNVENGSAEKLEGIPDTSGFASPTPAVNSRGDVVFVLADEGPSGNLWLYEQASGNFRPLTRSAGELSGVWAKDPEWFPDDRTVIYAASREDPFNTHLWSIDVDSGETLQISSGAGGYHSPAVSANGAVVTYVHARPFWRLMRSNLVTGEQQVLYETRGAVALPVVSADGQQIAYFGDGIHTLPVSGGQPRNWTDEDPLSSTLPIWSRSEPVLWFYRDRALHQLDTRTGESEKVLDDFHWSKQNWLAAHGNTLAYRVRSRIPGRGRTVLHNLTSGQLRKFKTDVLPTDFSRDGQSLLARSLDGSLIVICSIDELDCEPLMHESEAIAGAMPRWSQDEQTVFFRRARWDKPGYAYLWSAARDGSTMQRLVEVGPYASANFFFAVANDDSLIWPQLGDNGSSEIWQVAGPGSPVPE